MQENGNIQFHIAIAGAGGQGVLISGEVLAEAGIEKYKYIQFFPPPVALVRGGELECTVTLSNIQIAGFGSEHPEAGIIMGPLALQMLEKRVKPDGMLFVDSSIVKDKITREDLKIFYLPASETAQKLGFSRISNMFMLGAFAQGTQALPLNLLEQTIEKRLKGGRGEKMIPLNKEAIREGARLVADYKGP